MTQGESPITRSELREELQHYATKADIAEVKADMAQMETRLVKWLVGINVWGGRVVRFDSPCD